jgi:hypothetical protein
MNHWSKRSSEIANLFNPAFCAGVIYSTFFSYQMDAKQNVPFAITYLILPIVLHKKTRDRINLRSRPHMHVWIQNNPDVLVQFAQRAKSLVAITNEAIDFLLQNKIIEFANGGINIIKTLSASKFSLIDDAEMRDCFAKSKHVGKWFAKSGAIENIFVAWGVKP